VVVRKAGRGYKVYSKTGRALSKKPKSRAAAMRQLRAVEAAKRRRAKG
jgi:hypothetical protein